MKKLIITEKPSVAQQFANALGVSGRRDGYIENENYIITWCVGHLVTMSYPEKYDMALKKWSLESLPFLPETYKYEIIKDVSKQFRVVKECLNRKDIDTIYNAGDSGREGEYIQRLVYKMAGYNKNAAMKRIWIDSQTDEAIRKGIRDAKDASEYDRLSDAAYMRGIGDYVIGINFSRALSCKFGYEFNKKIKSSDYVSIDVGRVMTCVLGMIVEREREIRKFKPTYFYKLEADTGFTSSWKAIEESYFYESPLLYNETGFKEKSNAEKLLRILQKDRRLKALSVEKKTERKKAPLLYNLAELQNECAKRFKIGPDKTLEIAQKLYENKLTTYPRTDARVLSTAVAEDLTATIKRLSNYEYKKEYTEYILANSLHENIINTQYCDDSKITDHYAIIPTGHSDISALNELEINVFHLIIERFLSIFYPAAEYEKIEVVLMHPSKEKFFASEKTLTKYGYLEIIGYDEKEKKQALLNIKEGDILSAEFDIKEGQTTPPKRYNTGSLILAMENAGNLIEDEELRAQIKGSGIGTSATRADIIKKLNKNHYIVINPKTQIVTPHDIGEALYDVVAQNMPALLNPKMTASWEKGLAQIESGETTKERYKESLYAYVRKNIESVKGKEAQTGGEGQNGPLNKEVGICPLCGGKIVTTQFGCNCSNYQEKKCWFSIGSYILKNIGQSQFDKLLSEGKTDIIDGFISKKGNKFSAYIVVDKAEKKVKMEFPEIEENNTEFICPNCNDYLTLNGMKLSCKCGFSIYTSVCQKKLTNKQIESLLDGEEVYVTQMRSKKDKLFDAKVSFLEGKFNFQF